MDDEGWLQVFETKEWCPRTTSHKFEEQATFTRFKAFHDLRQDAQREIIQAALKLSAYVINWQTE
jgi:hypothetical protein